MRGTKQENCVSMIVKMKREKKGQNDLKANGIGWPHVCRIAKLRKLHARTQ